MGRGGGAAGATWIVRGWVAAPPRLPRGSSVDPAGREEHALLASYGLTPIQRLHREALSEHGDALACGARGTMRPYGVDVAEAEACGRHADISLMNRGGVAAGTRRFRGDESRRRRGRDAEIQ